MTKHQTIEEILSGERLAILLSSDNESVRKRAVRRTTRMIETLGSKQVKEKVLEAELNGAIVELQALLNTEVSEGRVRFRISELEKEIRERVK